MYEGIVNEVYQRYRVPYELQLVLKSQIHTESGWNPSAESPKGARGLTQFMPDTARRFGGIIWGNSPQAVRSQTEAQVKYMNWLVKRYNGNITKAAMAYNMGEGNMDAYQKTGRITKGRPLPRETSEYVIKIQNRIKYYR